MDMVKEDKYESLKLSNQLCFRLYTASRLIVQEYEPYLKKLGITYTQYLVLLVLWEQDEQPINDIGKRLMLGINSTSPLIKRMQKLELVSRRGSESDKRQQIVFLTPKGLAMREEAAKIPSCMVNKLGECNLLPEEMLGMVPTLDKMICSMYQQIESAKKE